MEISNCNDQLRIFSFINNKMYVIYIEYSKINYSLLSRSIIRSCNAFRYKVNVNDSKHIENEWCCINCIISWMSINLPAKCNSAWKYNETKTGQKWHDCCTISIMKTYRFMYQWRLTKPYQINVWYLKWLMLTFDSLHHQYIHTLLLTRRNNHHQARICWLTKDTEKITNS